MRALSVSIAKNVETTQTVVLTARDFHSKRTSQDQASRLLLITVHGFVAKKSPLGTFDQEQDVSAATHHFAEWENIEALVGISQTRRA